MSGGAHLPRTPLPGRATRPPTVTLLALGVLVLTAANAVKFAAGLSHYALLQTLPLSAPPVYLPASGAAWALAGAALAVGLWRRARLAYRATFPAALLYSLQFWLDRLLLAAAGAANLNWPFAAGLNLLALALLGWMLTRRQVSGYFGAPGAGAHRLNKVE